MSIVEPPHHNNDEDERVAEGWINLRFQLSRKTLVWLLSGITTFGSGFVAGSMHEQSPVREFPQPEDSPPPIEFCLRGENEETLCMTRERES